MTRLAKSPESACKRASNTVSRSVGCHCGGASLVLVPLRQLLQAREASLHLHEKVGQRPVIAAGKAGAN